MPTPQDFQEIVVLKLLWRGLLAGAWGKKPGFYEFCVEKLEIYEETGFLGYACIQQD